MLLVPALFVAFAPSASSARTGVRDARPNVLLFLTDDQSWWQLGAYGDAELSTPAFDGVARRGALFTRAFSASAICTPSRSALLTGQDIWRLGTGGQFGSTLPRFDVFPLLMEAGGYRIGWTGKGWGPGRLAEEWGETNPLGRAYNRKAHDPTWSRYPKFNLDYAANFADFLAERDEHEDAPPWFFWCGALQPHRPYVAGTGVASGLDLRRVRVPGDLADHAALRSDLLDARLETEHADRALARMLALLEERGELTDTVVIVTSDHGAALPRGKSNLYDAGTRVPLAIAWPGTFPEGRTIPAFVNQTDLAPTLLDLAGVAPPAAMTGRSLLALLRGEGQAASQAGRDFVVTAIENTYPIRALRTADWLYVWNPLPERDPPRSGQLDLLTSVPDFARLSARIEGPRAEEELYALANDPWQIHDVVGDPEQAEVLARLRSRLRAHLAERGDPRLRGEDPFGPPLTVLDDEFEDSRGASDAAAFGPEPLPQVATPRSTQARRSDRRLPARITALVRAGDNASAVAELVALVDGQDDGPKAVFRSAFRAFTEAQPETVEGARALSALAAGLAQSGQHTLAAHAHAAAAGLLEPSGAEPVFELFAVAEAAWRSIGMESEALACRLSVARLHLAARQPERARPALARVLARCLEVSVPELAPQADALLRAALEQGVSAPFELLRARLESQAAYHVDPFALVAALRRGRPPSTEAGELEAFLDGLDERAVTPFALRRALRTDVRAAIVAPDGEASRAVGAVPVRIAEEPRLCIRWTSPEPGGKAVAHAIDLVTGTELSVGEGAPLELREPGFELRLDGTGLAIDTRTARAQWPALLGIELDVRADGGVAVRASP